MAAVNMGALSLPGLLDDWSCAIDVFALKRPQFLRQEETPRRRPPSIGCPAENKGHGLACVAPAKHHADRWERRHEGGSLHAVRNTGRSRGATPQLRTRPKRIPGEGPHFCGGPAPEGLPMVQARGLRDAAKAPPAFCEIHMERHGQRTTPKVKAEAPPPTAEACQSDTEGEGDKDPASGGRSATNDRS